MKKIMMVLMGLLLACSTAYAFGGWGYQHVEPSQMKQWLEGGKKMVIVDIQTPDDFASHHFQGAIETNAFPTKSEEEQHRLDKAFGVYQEKPADVVVVCPRGGGGAQRAYDYLKDKGVPEEKLHILTGGMGKWPYPELVRSN